MLRRGIFTALGLLASFSFLSVAKAQTYPDRPIDFIVPYAAGSTNDNMARIVASVVSQNMKVPFVIMNTSGASGIVGTQRVANAKPDGYTLLWSAPSLTITTLMYAKPPYQLDQLVPVVYATSVPYVFVVSAATNAKSISELIALAKAKPGSINYGTGGSSSTTNLYMHRFMRLTGTQMTEVAYKGGPETMVALMGNQIQILPSQPDLALTGGDKVRILATSSASRNSMLPNVPTFREQGLDFVVDVWDGVFAPKGTPVPIVDRVNQEFNRALSDPAVRQKLSALGIDPHGGTAADFAAFLKDDTANWAQAIKDANIPKLDAQ
jgi:tripartite-type tricarboxylate transporter receptor subunit TctC